jgi:uncharacterized protein (DUF488 family)
VTNGPAAACAFFTIGHSGRSIDDFVALLDGQGVRRVVDIRKIPSSRTHPQFDAPAALRPHVRRGRMVALPPGRIVADYLLAHGEAVFHIMGPARLEPARLTPGALVRADGAVVYPAA